jgi:hypothetical protein
MYKPKVAPTLKLPPAGMWIVDGVAGVVMESARCSADELQVKSTLQSTYLLPAGYKIHSGLGLYFPQCNMMQSTRRVGLVIYHYAKDLYGKHHSKLLCNGKRLTLTPGVTYWYKS